jgi:hypothetical protein
MVVLLTDEDCGGCNKVTATWDGCSGYISGTSFVLVGAVPDETPMNASEGDGKEQEDSNQRNLLSRSRRNHILLQYGEYGYSS